MSLERAQAVDGLGAVGSCDHECVPQQSLGAASILIVLSFAAVGCGHDAAHQTGKTAKRVQTSTSQSPPTVSAAGLASKAEHEILVKRHVHVKVTCVPGAPQEKHETFNCSARLRDGRTVPLGEGPIVVRPPNEYYLFRAK
jgi:hypothetical protein